MTMKSQHRTYRDYDLSELIFGPGGVWSYLETNNRFRNKFGCTLNRSNFIEIIAKIIPEADRWNKSRHNMQGFVSIYNTVKAGNRSPDAPGQCHAVERTYEIIYVYCHVDRTKVIGLEEHLRNKGHGDLIDAAKAVYKEINDQRSQAIYMHDIANKLWSKFEELEALVTSKDEEILNAILALKEDEVQEAMEDQKQIKAEIRKQFEETEEKDLRGKIYTFIDNL